MVVKKSVIETGVDKLVKLVNERKKVSVNDAAKELGVPVSSIEEWADFLEEEGIISIQSRFATIYLIEKQIGKKELLEKVKAVREEKDEFMRRVESSINALERDSEEIKLIDSEFKEMKSILQDNFSKLCNKLDRIKDYRKAHSEIESKHEDVKEEYEKKLKDIDSKVKEGRSEYDKVTSIINEEADRLKREKAEVEGLKSSEKELQSKVDEINKIIMHVRRELETGNQVLAADEKRLKASEETAHRVKEEIESSSKELDSLSKQVKGSYKELDSMEKEFISNLESLDKGDVEKIGAYCEGKKLADKFKKFFGKTKEIEQLIHNAEKEEEELKEHFETLVKKAKAFSVLANIPDVKKEIVEIHEELAAVEERKKLLSVQLTKLRGLVRSVIK